MTGSRGTSGERQNWRLRSRIGDGSSPRPLCEQALYTLVGSRALKHSEHEHVCFMCFGPGRRNQDCTQSDIFRRDAVDIVC